MKLPGWLLGILFAAWTIWSTYDYFCNKCGCCGTASVPTIPTPSLNLSGAPLFKWGESPAITNDLFGAWRTKLLAQGGQGDTLTITGYYRKDEVNNSSFPNLGMARANAMKALFIPDVPDSRIKLAGKMVDGGKPATEPYESGEFAWSKMILKKEEGAIIESGASATILFPFNSTAKDSDPKVDAYLRELANKHKATKATFTVVGHTDNVGEDGPNIKLSLNRARAIQGLLVRYGIAQNRITIDSKGEAEPVADNNTEDGRHQNRRVVITVTP